MIKKIAHLADIHNRKSPTRNAEYKKVFSNLYKSLKKEKPDRIVIVGDLMHDYLDLQGEQLILVSNFLNNLSQICPLIITRGNHDVLRKSLKRIDPIEAIVEILNNKNITYLNETNFFEDDNIVWAVWKHGDKKSPWKRAYKKIDNKTYIDLYHDPIYESKTSSGFEFKNSNLSKIDVFKGDYSFFGDIHLQQYFKNKTKGYCGSLVAQDFSEGDDRFHGYLLWDINEKSVNKIEIKNEYSYKTVKINSFTDFDDLEIEIENPTNKMRIRVIWNCLPNTRTVENERKIKTYFNEKYDNIVMLTHKNDFLEDDVVDNISDKQLDNITSISVQHSIFEEYFIKIGVEKNTIKKIIELDDEITSRIKLDELTTIEWDVIKVWGENLFSYDKFNIDWRDLEGLTQITGDNAGGKTTLLNKSLSYILYGKTAETINVEKNGDSRFVNNKNNAKFCEGSVIIEANNIYYGIVRKTSVEKNKKGEIKSSPTTVKYYLLSSPDDEFNEDNLLDNLAEDRKIKTQREIEKVIGSYENFNRTVLTNSDTINGILSSKQSEFIDSILLDSGLDIFDVKTNEFKEYLREINKIPRIVCDTDEIIKKFKNLDDNIIELNKKNELIELNTIPNLNDRIVLGEKYVDDEVSSLFKIDDEVTNLDINLVKNDIKLLEIDSDKLISKKNKLIENKNKLIESFDSERLEYLKDLIEKEKIIENEKKFKIKNLEREIIEENHKVDLINGEIFLLEKEGRKIKEDILNLKTSKICPTCGQSVSDDAQKHIEKNILDLLDKTKGLILTINNKKEIIKSTHNPVLIKIKESINRINDETYNSSLESIKYLDEIGVLKNEKNDVETRIKLEDEIKIIPIQVENFQLKIKRINELIEKHNNSKLQIKKNSETSIKIKNGRDLLNTLRTELMGVNDNKINNKNEIALHENKKKEYELLIVEFGKQTKKDNILDLYKKAIHRNGIPKQILSSKLIPRINQEMNDLLNELDFTVWIDNVDLKLKLAYNNSLESFINAISGSGKERTFSSVVLKFALNQINMKSKPKIMLLDEMMGKLTGDSIDEFIDLLKIIKIKMKKVFIIEHNHELNPDNIINVVKSDDGISSYEIL